ncbi:MAG: hypothetical protein ACLSA6_01660 [Holdemania massiliensis]
MPEKRPLLPLEGHCPKISGADLAKFIASGVNADHTQQTPESIVEKITNGMFLEMQGKSINRIRSALWWIISSTNISVL